MVSERFAKPSGCEEQLSGFESPVIRQNKMVETYLTLCGWKSYSIIVDGEIYYIIHNKSLGIVINRLGVREYSAPIVLKGSIKVASFSEVWPHLLDEAYDFEFNRTT